MFIRRDDVSAIMKACFGEDADPDGEASLEITEVLRLWIPGRIPPEQLNDTLQNVLIRHLRRVLGAQLLIREGIRWRRVRTVDLEDAADRLMGLAFGALPEQTANYEMVKDWAFRAGSLSAMECLAKRFSGFQRPEEQALIAKVLSYRTAERSATDGEDAR